MNNALMKNKAIGISREKLIIVIQSKFGFLESFPDLFYYNQTFSPQTFFPLTK